MIARFVLMAGFVMSVAIAGVAQDESKVAAHAELNAGVQAFRQGHYEEASEHFEQAVTLEPEFTLAHLIWLRPMPKCLSRAWILPKM
jgi:Tfp pilus assembly protein PilF